MCVCAGEFLHSVGLGLVSLIPLGEGLGATCCDADPGFPKIRAFTCPRQPQTPQSLLFPACLSPLHVQLRFTH